MAALKRKLRPYRPATGEIDCSNASFVVYFDMPDGIIPDASDLLATLSYDAETGKLHRRSTGSEACATLCTEGYLRGSLGNSRCYAHRVIWKMVHGSEPGFIDHINGDRTDNRIANLREVEFRGNMRNRRTPASNASGAIGVSWNARRQRWIAEIRSDGRRVTKAFRDKDEAAKWRRAIQAEMGFHENHGR